MGKPPNGTGGCPWEAHIEYSGNSNCARAFAQEMWDTMGMSLPAAGAVAGAAVGVCGCAYVATQLDDSNESHRGKGRRHDGAGSAESGHSRRNTGFDRDHGVHLDTSVSRDITGIDLRDGDTVIHSTKLTDLHAGEKLDLRSELGVTNDLSSSSAQPGSRSFNGENRFDVQMQGSVVLAESPDATKGQRLLRGDSYVISPENHHGFYNQSGTFTVPKELDGKTVYLNTVAHAELEDAPGTIPENLYNRERANMVDLGGQPILTVDEGHNGLDVVRHAPDAPAGERMHAGGPDETFAIRGPESDTAKHPLASVMSIPLGRVEAGEVIDAQAWVKGYNPTSKPSLLSGEVILADSPGATEGASVSEHGGTNIPVGETGVIHHNGAIVVRNDMDSAYLNFVSGSGGGGDLINVLKGQGEMNAVRYRPNNA